MSKRSGEDNGSQEKAFAYRPVSRRDLLRRALVGGAVLSAPALLAACDSSSQSSGVQETDTSSAATARRGGRLRVGITGGGSSETLDPHMVVGLSNAARAHNLFDRLYELGPDGVPNPSLAVSLEPNPSADAWTVTLRSGVTFHNGQPLTADDVIYSFKRILDPANALQGSADIGMIDPAGMRKVDDLTLEMNLTRPYVPFPDAVSQFATSIIPADFTDFTNPVGTGPFKFVSWTLGEQSLFARNENYWREGRPYVDELEIISIGDPTARVNALVAGQVDAIDSPLLAQLSTLSNDNAISILSSQTGQWLPITLQVTAPPFSDVRVRQALRLVVDRQQMVDQVLLGQGTVGNDLFSPYDPDFASHLPQREQDIEQAKFLLRQAGYEDLAFELYTSDVATGMLESAVLFTEQAKMAGVTVKLNKVPADSFWDTTYLKVPVSQSNWANRALSAQLPQCLTSDAPYNETAWRRPEFDELVVEATATLDETKRRDLYSEIQQQLWDEGGYIIWGFANWLDAYRDSVAGFETSVNQHLGYWNFKDVWMTS